MKKTGGILPSSSWMMASALLLSVKSLFYAVNATGEREIEYTIGKLHIGLCGND